MRLKGVILIYFRGQPSFYLSPSREKRTVILLVFVWVVYFNATIPLVAVKTDKFTVVQHISSVKL